MHKPRIVCLCGSTRFYEEFVEANLQETMKGHIVLSVGVFGHRSEDVHGRHIDIGDKKDMLDELHKRKIDLADEILVINVGDSVGPSTTSEVKYAREQGKLVRWYSEDGPQS